MDPNHDMSLPPISNFHRGGSIPPTSSSAYSTSPTTVNGAEMGHGHNNNQPPSSQQSGDVLAKALGTVKQ